MERDTRFRSFNLGFQGEPVSDPHAARIGKQILKVGEPENKGFDDIDGQLRFVLDACQ